MNDKDLEEMMLEERREYYRKWRAANKDKVRRNNQNFWKRKVLQRLEQEAAESER